MRGWLSISLLLLLISGGCLADRNREGSEELTPNKVIPTEKQRAYQQMELIGFIHFSLNTFTCQEWGYGDEDPRLFDPSALDAEQWALTARKAGMKQLILTAKHHDGFCLWPSNLTEHSVKNSPYKNGEGDIVKEFTEACRKHGLKVGLYLSAAGHPHLLRRRAGRALDRK